MLVTGMYLSDRYEILEKIGSGGMSDVYKAKCHKLNRMVAIKVLKQDFSSDATFVKKFRVEAQSAAGLSHANIVGVYDVGEEDGIYYIVMELVSGITLKNYIKMKGRLEIKEALNISVQIASGLSAAHDNRIIHRDVKPQNIIMSRDGKVKVTDFGIAKAADSTTVTTNAAGSVHYISPEQARGGYSDAKSDIYSLGITMYEMVTGRVPFDGDSNVSVALLHIQGEIIPPRRIVESIPRSLEKIILKCTQKKPDRRYPSAKSLIEDLRKALAQPDGEYVNLAGIASGDTTVVMSEEDLSTLKNASANGNNRLGERQRSVTPGGRPVSKKEQPAKVAPRGKMAPIDEDDEDDEEVNSSLEKVMMVFGIIAALVIVVVIFFIVGKTVGLFGKGSDETNISTETVIETESLTETESQTDAEVEVPDVTKEGEVTAAQAKAELKAAGFEVEEEEGTSDTVKEGYVIKQTPLAGKKLAKGEKVTIVVSTGAEKFALPSVDGLTSAQAKQKLESNNLKVKWDYAYDDKVKEDHVIKTDPVAGEKVANGDAITVVISRGKEVVDVPLPSVAGTSKDSAKKALENAGFVVNSNITYEVSSNVTSGNVIRITDASGNALSGSQPKGTQVSLVVSLGDTLNVTVESISDQYYNIEGENTLDIKCINANGTPDTTTIKWTGQYKSQSVPITVGSTTVSIEIYVNGTKITSTSANLAQNTSIKISK